jgi:hypothetical protein
MTSYHNWIAKKLVEVNQNGQFKPWNSLNDKEKRLQDLRTSG